MVKNPPLGNQKWSHPPPDGSIIGKQNRFCLTAQLAAPILIHKRQGELILISLTLILSVRMLHPYPFVKSHPASSMAKAKRFLSFPTSTVLQLF